MMRSLVVVMAVGLAQASLPRVNELLLTPGELSPVEVESIVLLTSDLMVGKSFMSYGGFGGGTLTVGPGPRARSMLYGDRVTEWPGTPARRCDGTLEEGELVLEWEMLDHTWKVTPHASTDPRVMDGMFDLWSIEPELVQDAGFRDVEGVTLRGLRYPYAPPQGASFEASWQTVWFDSRTGLPLRYDIAIEGPDAMDYGYFFAWTPGWESRPDPAIERPDCVPVYGPHMGPQSPEEHAELADAVTRLYGDEVAAWSVRAPPVWKPVLPGTDRSVTVDLAAHEAAGRVRWHRSVNCSRSFGEHAWKCWGQAAETLVDVAELPGRMAGPSVCPAIARNIAVARNVEATMIPELSDFVRSVGASPERIPRTSCRSMWTRLGRPALCGISAIRSPEPGRFRVSATVGPAHFLVLKIRRECADDVCALRLSGCAEVIY